MRAFLAIPLPPPTRQALASVANQIEGLRAQKPHTLHLTIRFLDEIADPAPIIEAVTPVAAAHPAFEMSLERIGVFPRKGAPRVVWVGLGAGEMQAGALAAGVENALLPLGFRRDRRPWHGHITLGRYRTAPRRGQEPVDADRQFGRVPAEKLVLFESTLTADGAVHDVVQEMSLGCAK